MPGYLAGQLVALDFDPFWKQKHRAATQPNNVKVLKENDARENLLQRKEQGVELLLRVERSKSRWFSMTPPGFFPVDIFWRCPTEKNPGADIEHPGGNIFPSCPKNSSGSPRNSWRK